MYQHKVQYYETDKMGVTHHSNYVRWMEEARIQYLAETGWSYKRIEEEGIISPVVSVECHYKKTTTFDDLVNIEVCVLEFTGVKLKLGYKMYLDDKLVCDGTSMHCFLNSEGRPVRLKKDYPDLYETFNSLKVTEE